MHRTGYQFMFMPFCFWLF